MNADGIDVWDAQLESLDANYLTKLKRLSFLHGLHIYCLAIDNNFVHPDANKRNDEVERVRKCLKIAHGLGAKAMTIYSGGWGTLSFDELKNKNGIEPPLTGYTQDDAYDWVVDSIRKCIPLAEEYGIVMVLENHWGLTTKAEGVLRIVNSVNSDWLKACMDVGNFIINDQYEELERIAPYVALVHAKTYYGGGIWYDLDIDYKRIFQILNSVNYRGYITIEYEGKENYNTGIPKTIKLLETYLK